MESAERGEPRNSGIKSSETLVPHPFGFPFQDAGSVAWLRPPLHHRPGTVLCGSMHSVRPGLHAPHTFIPFFYENRSEKKNKNKKHRRLEICVRMHVRLRVWLWLSFMCASLSLWLLLVYLSDFVKNFHNLFFSSSSVTRPRACFLSCPRVE